MNIINRETVIGDLWKLEQRIGVKHGCVAADFSAVMGGTLGGESGNQTWDQAQSNQHTISANISCVGGVVELSTDSNDAIGFEPESVWPVIAMLWDVHGYKGVYDLGVVGVWMSGLGQMLYVCGVHSYE